MNGCVDNLGRHDGCPSMHIDIKQNKKKVIVSESKFQVLYGIKMTVSSHSVTYMCL